VNVYKVRVTDSQLGEVLGELGETLACLGTRFRWQKEEQVGYERGLRRRVKLPTQRFQDRPFHLFNVLGTELTSTEIGQCTELDLSVGIVQLDRDMKGRQRCE